MIDTDEVTVAVEQGAYLKRAVRLMLIARDLASGYHTVEVLAEKYGVCERSIYRDLAELQDDPLRVPLVNYSVWRSIGDSHN